MHNPITRERDCSKVVSASSIGSGIAIVRKCCRFILRNMPERCVCVGRVGASRFRYAVDVQGAYHTTHASKGHCGIAYAILNSTRNSSISRGGVSIGKWVVTFNERAAEVHRARLCHAGNAVRATDLACNAGFCWIKQRRCRVVLSYCSTHGTGLGNINGASVVAIRNASASATGRPLLSGCSNKNG